MPETTREMVDRIADTTPLTDAGSRRASPASRETAAAVIDRLKAAGLEVSVWLSAAGNPCITISPPNALVDAVVEFQDDGSIFAEVLCINWQPSDLLANISAWWPQLLAPGPLTAKEDPDA